jgi:hypothetical protein
MRLPYRDDQAALRERLEALDARLDEVQNQARRLGELERERAKLEAERAEVASRLSAYGQAFELEELRVASPCNVDWGSMVGDDQVRFCLGCQKNVYNLSGMTREAATAFVRDKEGEVCIRMYRRADGTVLTSDCPDGERRKRRRLALLSAGGGLMAAAAAALPFRADHAERRPPEAQVAATFMPPHDTPAPAATPPAVDEKAAVEKLKKQLEDSLAHATMGRLVPVRPKGAKPLHPLPGDPLGMGLEPGDPLAQPDVAPAPKPKGGRRAK